MNDEEFLKLDETEKKMGPDNYEWLSDEFYEDKDRRLRKPWQTRAGRASPVIISWCRKCGGRVTLKNIKFSDKYPTCYSCQ